MRRIKTIFHSSVAAIILASFLASSLPAVAQADSANGTSLVISQLKITSSNGQFVTLYNASQATLDMSKYQLEYFNSYDLTKATSSRLIALSGTLPPHGYFMINDSALLLCYQLTIDSISLGFSSTAGLVEVLGFNQSSPGNSVTPTLQDYVGWSKTAASGAQTLPSSTNAFLERQPVNAQNNPSISVPGAGSWQAVQPDAGNGCNLVTSGPGTVVSVPTGLSQLLPGTEPPVTVTIGDNEDQTISGMGLPAADVGLMAPEITEILPNPAGTGNDGTDEFIELYNPNAVSFDLSGFSLQVGTTSLHTFTFPSGASLPARGFTAFYSADTHLSLSNTGGQAKLLDPSTNAISTTDEYSSAKDGQSWGLANGQWYWTISPTPGAANIIHQPVASSSKSTKTSSSKTKTAAKVSTKRPKTSKIKVLKSAKTGSDTVSVTPIHLWTLALIAGLALLYGVYEYRADLANRVHQLRRHLRARRADRA